MNNRKFVQKHAVAAVFSVALATAAFGAYAPAVNWIHRDGVGTSPTNMADYFDSANWEGGVPAGSPSVSVSFPKFSGIRYVRFDRDFSLGGMLANGVVYPRDLSSSPRLVLVGDEAVVDTCASSDAARYPLEGVDLYGDFDHAEWSYFTSFNLAGDTLHAGQVVLAWGIFSHRLDWYAKTCGGARTNALATTSIYQGSGSIAFYAPESSAVNVTGQWSGTAGSRFLHRTGADHPLPSGTLVHGAGIPEGTFLKRVFTREEIELSQPLAADLDGDVTFDAQTSRVYQHFDNHGLYSNITTYMRANKYRAEDDFVIDIDIDNVSYGAAAPVVYSSDSTWHPATLRIHDGTRMRLLGLGRVHLDFVEAGNGNVNGYPNTLAYTTDADGGEARLTVGGDLSATFGTLTNLVTTVAKDGTGTLTIGFDDTKASGNGGLAVREGTLIVSNRVADATSELGEVTVAAGAVLRVEGSLVCASLALADGARLVIPAGSRLAVENAALKDLPPFEGEGELVSTGTAGLSDAPLYELPAAKVAGRPAFWVDACTLTNAVPAGILEVEGGTTYVSRWNDCRSSAEGGTHFATNRWARPHLVAGRAAGPYVEIGGSGVKTVDLLQALVWDAPLTNIRHVFYVLDPTDGGGTILGNTSAVSGDFVRGGVGKENDLVYSGTPNAYVKNATIYLDDVKTNRTGNLKSAVVPTLLEMPLAGPAKANAFGTINFYGTQRLDLSGNARIHEYVIYTNALTAADRMATRAYLLKKWKGAVDVAYTTFPEGEDLGKLTLRNEKTGVAPAAGDAVGVRGLEGAGTFVKSGAGTAYLTDATNEHANVIVRGGTLSVRSTPPPSVDAVPVSDSYLHVDASKTNTLTWTRRFDIDRISKWCDVEHGIDLTPMSSSTTNQPRVRLNALNGLAMVDFGPAMGSRNNYAQDHAALSFRGSLKLQTIFSVLDTAGGGGALLGGSAGRNDTPAAEKYHGLWRDVQSWPSWYQQPLIMGTSNRNIDGRTLNASVNSGDYVNMSKTQVRLNQELVDQANTGFTGGFDMFSVRSTTNMRSNLLGGIHYGWSFGGMSYGEVIYYERYLSLDELNRVERYLAYKWFNRTTAMWRPATLGSVAVAANAALCVEGGAPLAVSGISGSGSVTGDVTLAAGGEVGVEVTGGVLSPLTVSGSLSLPATATMRLTGDLRALPYGSYPIVVAGSLVAESVSGWTILAPERPRRLYILRVTDTSLVLDVMPVGTVLIVK